MRQGIPVSRPLQNWDDAIALLFASVRGQPRVAVIDEFPFLVKASPALPSIIQRELGPGGSGMLSAVRLLLCGSAMSVMGQLLAGHAPLRGRASLELLIRPFGFSDAARFWDVREAELAVLLHAIVGGTDPALYHSVLAAIATGNRTNGGIASFVGRKSAEITHPLNVLEDCALIAKEPDLFRRGRWTYQVTEPLITFYEVVMRPEWSRLESGHAEPVWRDRQADFLSRVAGPHFESLCRSYALAASSDLFGAPAGEVGSGVVKDPVNRTQIEIDVAVLAPREPGRQPRLLSLGEVKWGTVMGRHHTERLARARHLLSENFDTSECVLACYSAAGFHDDLRATTDARLALITLDQIYGQ